MSSLNQIQPARKRILAVDDSQEILSLIGDILEMAGYDVITSSSGRAGLNLILKEPNQFDLLLIDMNIGDMTGSEFLNELEQRQPGFLATVPAVLLSAVQAVPKTLAKGFIQKPFAIQSFLASIHSHFGTGTGAGG